MSREDLYEELDLRGVELRPRARDRAANLLKQTIVSQAVAGRTEDVENLMGLEKSGLDLSHPSLGMDEDGLKTYLLRRCASDGS